MFTDYRQTLTYLYQNLPMFQRVGAAAYKADLGNTIALCEALDNPQNAFKSIHIAGTNGKGSTSHMLASVLQSSGYKTGLYTSPHLKDFTERIKINGREIGQAQVIDFVNRIKPRIENIRPSFFEITVAMAFDYFASQQVDVAVIETGLGGRLDSTNVISPVLSVITNIGFDHKDILGDTLAKIAAEKAGIIKDKTPVVVSERQPEVENVFITRARHHHAPLVFAGDEFRITQNDSWFEVIKNDGMYLNALALPLKGKYQMKNLAGVLKVCEILNQNGFKISIDQIRNGLEKTVTQTGLKGRWQQLSANPVVICDTGHNADGVREIVTQIDQQKFKTLHIVWGMVKDKEPDAVLSLLPKNARYYFC
ncbi:MAG TPA: folylpolyglutamate synthase/dihydrofolate synthase family protein, partial [Cyclobacteriaceae bacterium]|nr:folylpolyglutamate synthase/dihydrofolate synthase family protein [Cyclobacteriaceae bacterium]